MINKLFKLAISIIKGEIVFDYKLLGIQRERHFKVPFVTNYIRISSFELVVEEILRRNVEGNVAEVGVYKGEFAKYLNKAFPTRKLYLFDTFEGFNNLDVSVEKSKGLSNGEQDFSQTSVNLVLSKMNYKDNCVIKKGYFPDSLDGLEDKFCFVSLDPDLYKPIYDGLEYFYPRLNKGGFIFIHDYNNELYPGAKKAVLEFTTKYNIPFVPICDSWGTAVIAK